MTKIERYCLTWLAESAVPRWGHHLRVGQPITDADMARWLRDGWIEAVGVEGYRITDAGRLALAA